MIGLDNGLWLIVGAVAAFIGLQTRARQLVQLAPIAAFLLAAIDYTNLVSVGVPEWVRPPLTGAALAVLVLRGGK